MERAVRVLRSLAESGGLRQSDLSERLGLSKSTLSDLLSTMESCGLVEREPASRAFRLGPMLVDLGLAARSDPDLVMAARRELVRLSGTTGETAILHVPSGEQAVIIDACESRHQLKVVAPVGHRLPAMAGSVAKVLMAAAGDDRLAAALGAGPLPAFTDRSITDPDIYLERLHLVRRRGYAIDDEEYLPGVRAVSAPVTDRSGQLVAVVTVVGASSRLARDRLPALGVQVRAAAARVSGSAAGSAPAATAEEAGS